MNILSVLDRPIIYSLFQKIMGADQGWKRFVENHAKIRTNDTVLDIGCGPSDILPHLPTGTDYWGFDPNEKYVQSAQKKTTRPWQIKCKELQHSDLKTLPKIDIVLLCGVLHHVDDNEANRILSLVSSCIGSHGRLTTFDPCLVKNQNIFAAFLIKNDRGLYVRTERQYRDLLSNHFNTLDISVVNQEWVPYTHCVTTCRNN
jgi:SAM-dependent methyltransferase